MIDEQGYRANVGMILINKYQEVFWARRVGQENAWQFPQGGIDANETPKETLYRELYEEVGLRPEHVKLLGESEGWLRYHLPRKYMRLHSKPLCIGQKQRWFLLEVRTSEDNINFNCGEKAEFDHWRWVHYWYPVNNVIAFKSSVYKKALQEFKPIVFGGA
jgi:putative (di)nucleoside polyphosphate hydrolase